ncbi:MAG: 16S rRNA (cytosine(1402)-N(4))-methyltransferase RsmH [Rickettsiaceae bacterium]
MDLSSTFQTQQYSAHYPVLLAEVLEHLSLKDGNKYLDCTFGAGGYTKAILASKDCQVIALDQDPTVKIFADEVKREFGDKFAFMQTNFVNAAQKLDGNKFNGIVLDLGISSMQVDQAERGFSFMQDGPLDMRMSNKGITAAEFLETAEESEIANVIYKYGEEVQSRSIAKAIVEYRQKSSIDTTAKLADIVRNSMHYRNGKIDTATKTFQAIRIFINKELESLEQFLAISESLLLPGGRLVVVSFHSLEDSIVKNFFKSHSLKKVAKSKYAKEPEIIEDGKWLKVVTKKPVVPSRAEILLNNRSRSAKLRAAEKVGGSNAA